MKFVTLVWHQVASPEYRSLDHARIISPPGLEVQRHEQLQLLLVITNLRNYLISVNGVTTSLCWVKLVGSRISILFKWWKTRLGWTSLKQYHCNMGVGGLREHALSLSQYVCTVRTRLEMSNYLACYPCWQKLPFICTNSSGNRIPGSQCNSLLWQAHCS